MKSNKVVYALSLMILTGSLVFTSCKKRKEFKEENGQTSTDNRTAQSENDNAMNDANSVIYDQPMMHGRTGPSANVMGISSTTICGLTVDTNGIHLGKITLNYTGVTCNNRTRTGTIKLAILNYSSGVRWKHANAVLQVDYINYKITRASDGKSVEFNGTQFVTNKSGGTWIDLYSLTQSSLITEVTGNDLHVSFDGTGGTAIYNINRRFTYTLPSGILTCTGEGIGSSSGRNNLENYGTTREGDAFTSEVTTPIVWNLTCGWWAPTQGAVDIKVDSKAFDLKVTFAVDASGNSVAVAPNACAYGFKVEWTYKKKTNKKIFGYL
jgi:hypothetical protein